MEHENKANSGKRFNRQKQWMKVTNVVFAITKMFEATFSSIGLL